MAEKEIHLEPASPQATLAMHPLKFSMWLAILSIVMIFASLTSAYLVSKGERLPRGAWLTFELPSMFWFSTAIILLSSLSMHWSFESAKKDNFFQLKLGVVTTTLLGFIFLVTQVVGWQEMVDINVFFGGSDANPAGSYVYVFSGLHAAHLVGGLVFLVVLFVKTFQSKVHAKNLVTIEMAATYWHFLDALWVYLFLFLLFSRV